jgi:hypothetical protein
MYELDLHSTGDRPGRDIIPLPGYDVQIPLFQRPVGFPATWMD